jgi:hypothetical protein
MIRLLSLQTVEGGCRKPGATAGSNESAVASYFTAASAEKYTLSYDPDRQLVHIVRGPNMRSIAMARVREMEVDLTGWSDADRAAVGLPVEKAEAKAFKPGAATKSLAGSP